MALDTRSTAAAAPPSNGTASPSPEEYETLYAELLKLQDVVLAGKHPDFKLPPSAIEQLKAGLGQKSAPLHGGRNGVVNGTAPTNNTQQQQPSQSPSTAPQAALPGLRNAHASAVNGGSPFCATASSVPAGLDPIFLQKSDHLVRAEAGLKRQRLERDLQIQADPRKQSARDRDINVDMPSLVDVDLILRTALQRQRHISALKTQAKSAASSSFDENDYYSSQVQSAFDVDFERLDGASAARTAQSKRPAKANSSMASAFKDQPKLYGNDFEDVYGVEDDDDEYMPPDAAAIDTSRGQMVNAGLQQVPPPADDDSDYEPGEISPGYRAAGPSYQPAQASRQPPANVPVIRNHLTHIAAPQPNRVSPLTTAHNSGVELELVNGKPEIVQKPAPRQQVSRVSSASPSGFGGYPNSKKKNNNANNKKKRKREIEAADRSKRRQKKLPPAETARSPVNQEAFIKDEPFSPPPSVPDVPQFQQAYTSYAPQQIDLTQSGPPQVQYVYEPRRPAPRYEYSEPQQVIRVASPAQRPLQRDTQDLRRVASMQLSQRPGSRSRPRYSPVSSYRATSMAYGDPRLHAGEEVNAPRQASYAPPPPAPTSQIPRPRSRSPVQLQNYQDAYSSRGASPALMPPPPAPPARRIVQDQYGNKYYAAESAPAPAATPRLSAVPDGYGRAPSRAAYTQPQAQAAPTYYEPAENRMPPPPPPVQRQSGREEAFEYTDADGYLVRGYRVRPAEQPPQSRYSEAPTSPTYQEYPAYEQMPPPPARQAPRQTHEPTSPDFSANVSRSYSMRPEEPVSAAPSHLRQASVAPVQYAPLRQGSVAPIQYASQPQSQPAPPQRAVSVMPGYEYGGAQVQQQGYAPVAQQAPRFVDQYGNPVFPREVRQMEGYYQG